MIKQWFFRNIIGISITLAGLITVSLLIISLLNNSVITNRVNALPLREAPNRTAKAIAHLDKGERLIILDEDNDWYKVRLDDDGDDSTTGWVASWVAESTVIDTATPISETTILLDPGHGGDPADGGDTGAISNDKEYYEKTYTLLTAQKTKAVLEQTGARVLMTRDKDELVYLAHIAQMSNDRKVDAFISFHYDSSGEANSATGITQYYYNENGSEKIAEYLSNELDQLPLTNRGVKSGDFWVIHHNSQPAVLLELGYMNNDDDVKYITSDKYHKEVANHIKTGLTKYFSDN